jgi:hypothetical protein
MSLYLVTQHHNRERLLRRKNIRKEEKKKLSQNNLTRGRIVADREAAKAADKEVKDKIPKLADAAKEDLEGYYNMQFNAIGRTKVGSKLLTMEAHGMGRMLER